MFGLDFSSNKKPQPLDAASDVDPGIAERPAFASVAGTCSRVTARRFVQGTGLSLPVAPNLKAWVTPKYSLLKSAPKLNDSGIPKPKNQTSLKRLHYPSFTFSRRPRVGEGLYLSSGLLVVSSPSSLGPTHRDKKEEDEQPAKAAAYKTSAAQDPKWYLFS